MDIRFDRPRPTTGGIQTKSIVETIQSQETLDPDTSATKRILNRFPLQEIPCFPYLDRLCSPVPDTGPKINNRDDQILARKRNTACDVVIGAAGNDRWLMIKTFAEIQHSR